MLSASRNAPEVRERMKQLTQERQALRAVWAARNDQLHDCLGLQLFNREAKQVEGVVASHEAMLANEDIGVRIIDGGFRLLAYRLIGLSVCDCLFYCFIWSALIL